MLCRAYDQVAQVAFNSMVWRIGNKNCFSCAVAKEKTAVIFLFACLLFLSLWEQYISSRSKKKKKKSHFGRKDWTRQIVTRTIRLVFLCTFCKRTQCCIQHDCSHLFSSVQQCLTPKIEKCELFLANLPGLFWVIYAGGTHQCSAIPAFLVGLHVLMTPPFFLGMIIGKCCTMPLSVWFLVVAGLGPSDSWRLCR